MSVPIQHTPIQAAESMPLGQPAIWRSVCEAWATRFGWDTLADDTFYATCETLLAASGAQTVAPELIHKVCSGALSNRLYTLCRPEDPNHAHSRDHAVVLLRQSLARYVRRLLHDDDLALEVASDALSAVLLKIATLKIPRAFLGYCQVAAVRRARKVLAATRRRETHETSLDGDCDSDDDDTAIAEVLQDPDSTTEAIVERRHTTRAFWRLLAHRSALKPRERRVVYLRFYDGLRAEEIARAIGTSRRAVDILWCRARKKLLSNPEFTRELRELGYHCLVER